MKRSGSRSARLQRVDSEVQRALATLLPRAVHDPRVGNLTVTAVRAAADLGTVRVYFLPFGGARSHSPEEIEAGLRSAAGFLRGEVGRQLGLRHAPRLEFHYDVELERAERLDRLIDAAVAGQAPPPADDPGS
ncbi:MAG: 30S ribosome-binding factor RbfA [Gammaproteobacteria bacterium]|nr:30S ribosome-binding factor RbfA [Gammaproteobacteria bacterium]